VDRVDTLKHAETVKLGQNEIQQHEVHPTPILTNQQINGSFAIRRRECVVPKIRHDRFEVTQLRRVILDDEYFLCHFGTVLFEFDPNSHCIARDRRSPITIHGNFRSFSQLLAVS